MGGVCVWGGGGYEEKREKGEDREGLTLLGCEINNRLILVF